MTNYLSAMTVKDLRTVASRLDIKGRSGMDKNTLMGHIGEAVETAHTEALAVQSEIQAEQDRDTLRQLGRVEDISTMEPWMLRMVVSSIVDMDEVTAYAMNEKFDEIARETAQIIKDCAAQHDEYAAHVAMADEIYTVTDVENETDENEPVSDPIGTIIKNGIKFFSGWQCCKNRPAKVMTFDDGARWAVCLSCAGTVSPDRISDFSDHGLFVIAEPVNGNEPVIFDGATAELLIAHDKRVKRFNPSVRRDKAGQVCLTPKQRRRVQKNMRQHAKAVGFFA